MTHSTGPFRWTRWLPEIAIVVVWTSSFLGMVWGFSAERADVLSRIHAGTLQAADHEARLRTLEKQTGEMAADVRWIRQTLEKQKP